MTTTDLLNKLLLKEDLTKEEIDFLFEQIVHEQIDPIQLGGILVALRMKGEGVNEIVGFIQTMRKYMIPVSLGDVMDTCGTGGDGVGTFNISTAVAFILAGAGVKIAKHGNKAVSGKCGSADVLNELGVVTTITNQQAKNVFQKTGMVFLFAPLFHPIMKHVAAVRKQLGVRTIFNLLGPFTNPASAKRQIIGVPNNIIAEKMAKVVAKLDYTHVIIVTSADGMDEMSISAPTTLYEIKYTKITRSSITPEMFGIKRKPQSEILGKDSITNAKIIKDIFNGKKGAKRDIVVLNSGVGLYVAGKVISIQDGVALAEESIDKGYAKKILENLIMETKRFSL